MITPDDNADFAPGTLVDHGDGQYSVIYSAFPDFGDLFTRKGLPGGGQTWHAMVMHLLEEHAPEALESLDLHPETGTFSAQSDSLVALRAVAQMLRKLENRDVVADLIEHVDLTQYE